MHKIYCNLKNLAGGLIAIYIYSWQLIAWEYLKGNLKLVQYTEKRIVSEDGNESYSLIDFLSLDEPNMGLGLRLCPTP